jgi:hypothetical protein
MAFSQATISEVFPPLIRQGQAFLSWSSSSPAGTFFQVYLNAVLAWSGQARSAWVSIPSGPVHIDIGTVAAGEENTDFSGSLASAPARRAELSWLGGTFEAPDIAGFKVYGESTPGGGINYGTVLADITAYPAGILTDGFGLGSFGTGGFGRVAGTYTWTSEPLGSGTWSFAVVPYDAAGNAGTGATTTVTIAAPPREPAFGSDGITRLTYQVLQFGDIGYGAGGFGLPEAALTWNASPP